MKTCSDCGRSEPEVEFYEKPKSPRCKKCYSNREGTRVKTKYARRRYWINRYKVAKGCLHCGFNESPAALEFHHLDPTDKEFGPSNGLHYKLTDLFNELRKCVVLCSNHHRMLHAGELVCEPC